MNLCYFIIQLHTAVWLIWLFKCAVVVIQLLFRSLFLPGKEGEFIFSRKEKNLVLVITVTLHLKIKICKPLFSLKIRSSEKQKCIHSDFLGSLKYQKNKNFSKIIDKTPYRRVAQKRYNFATGAANHIFFWLTLYIFSFVF